MAKRIIAVNKETGRRLMSIPIRQVASKMSKSKGKVKPRLRLRPKSRGTNPYKTA